jgi:hypothetical protein
MIKGITVQLLTLTYNGRDRFNRPIYTEKWVDVTNVLVGQPTTEEIEQEKIISGKIVSYILAIPKGDTHNWTDTQVQFFGQTFRTIGIPTQGIDENIPLKWNKKVRVEAYV